MPGRIFINYRRGDEPGFAGRLYDRLEAAFASDSLFMDVDNIPAGVDFVRVLEDEVGKCDVLLAVIGRGWVTAEDESGTRRLDNPHDFVRIEIESGLKLGKRIIPVLINNADMPRADDLPESLRALTRRNAVRLTHERFKADAQGLVKILQGAIEEAEAARTARSEAERQAVEDAARRKQEEEAARSAEAERQAQRARQQAAFGLSADEIRKAEELANWEFIKSAADSTELRNHLARFPGGVTERYAGAALEEALWTEISAAPDAKALEAFVMEFPRGKRATEASARLNELRQAGEALRLAEERRLRETEAWAKASNADSLDEYQAFLAGWPKSPHGDAARSRIKKLKSGEPGLAKGGWGAVVLAYSCAAVVFWLLIWLTRTNVVAPPQALQQVTPQRPPSFQQVTPQRPTFTSTEEEYARSHYPGRAANISNGSSKEQQLKMDEAYQSDKTRVEQQMQSDKTRERQLKHPEAYWQPLKR